MLGHQSYHFSDPIFYHRAAVPYIQEVAVGRLDQSDRPMAKLAHHGKDANRSSVVRRLEPGGSVGVSQQMKRQCLLDPRVSGGRETSCGERRSAWLRRVSGDA